MYIQLFSIVFYNSGVKRLLIDNSSEVHDGFLADYKVLLVRRVRC